MPQDPDLYGQRPLKRQKKEIPLSSSLAFTSQLTSLLATPSTTDAAHPSSASKGRPRSAKTDSLFRPKEKKRKSPKDASAFEDGGARLALKDVSGTEEDKQELIHRRRKMEEKARLYSAMKRGDYIPKEGETAPLVDFDSKWAQSHPEDLDRYSSSGTDNDDDDGSAEVIEYKDEFGRTRKGTRADLARLDKREKRMALGEEELERMSARPKAPENVIYGDAIQSQAFNPEDDTWNKMEELAAKRDREPTPPEDTHYDGNWEIRDKGVGFYHFSKDNDLRAAEMENLKKEREHTEQVRKDRELERERRRKEIEERRRKLGQKRAEKLADNFLDDLAGELLAGGGSKRPDETNHKPTPSHDQTKSTMNGGDLT